MRGSATGGSKATRPRGAANRRARLVGSVTIPSVSAATIAPAMKLGTRKHHIGGADSGREHAMGRAVCSVAGLRTGHEDMPLGEEAGERLGLPRARVALAHDTGITVEIKPLPPQVPRGFRKGAEREIRLPAFEPVFELARVQRYRTNTDVWRDHSDARDQRWKEADHADISQQEAKTPIRSRRIEFAQLRAKTIGRGE